MKALHFLRLPLIILLAGYLAFLIGSFSRGKHWPLSEPFIATGYGMITIAIVWIIIKFIFLKPTENDKH